MNRWLVVSILLTLAALGAALCVYSAGPARLPARIPVHWNLWGEPDGFVSADNALPYFLLLPAVMAGVILLTLLLPWLSPRSFGVDEFRDTYHYIMALIVAMVGYLQAVALLSVLRPGVDVSRLTIAGLFLFFALLGNVLGKVRRNFWIGVRTPWTLASEAVWIRTHRLSAWLLVLAGVFGCVGALAGVHLVWCFAALGVAVLVPAVYSLVIYKSLARQGRL